MSKTRLLMTLKALMSMRLDHIKKSILEAANKVLGKVTRHAQRPWISQDTLAIIEQRRHARLNNHISEFRRLNAARNRSLENDKRDFLSRTSS